MHRVLSRYPEPDVPDAEIADRLATGWGRFRAHVALHLDDHQFLRVLFQNEHRAGPDMVRTNQPSPAQLSRWAAKGMRTVVNLRGVSRASFHVLERDACARLGLPLVTFRVASRDAPLPDLPRAARDLFAQIAYPALMHCKSGADRAGLMGVLYRHLHLGEPIETAREQLSFRYLHVNAGKTGILDAYLDHYAQTGAARGLDMITWSETVYDPDAFKAGYEPGPIGDFLVERILRRE